MRRWALVWLALALAGCAGSNAGSAGATVPSGSGAVCGPRSAVTLAADRHVRVYKQHGAVFGCARHHKSHRLGGARTCVNSTLVGPVRVAGWLAAYGLERCGVDTGSTVVEVRRLTDGRRLAMRPATTGPPQVESYQSVTSLVLRSDGSVAWIATSKSVFASSGEIEVHSLAQGDFDLLDSGSGIAPKSLRLKGATLSWRDGGSVRTATLN
jgi:hypothetical protein